MRRITGIEQFEKKLATSRFPLKTVFQSISQELYTVLNKSKSSAFATSTSRLHTCLVLEDKFQNVCNSQQYLDTLLIHAWIGKTLKCENIFL